MNLKLIPALCAMLLGLPPLVAAGTADFAQANRQPMPVISPGPPRPMSLSSRRRPACRVFYNLGNSYQRLGKYGYAILAYERARLLTPRDPDLSANLALARKAAAAFDEPAPIRAWMPRSTTSAATNGRGSSPVARSCSAALPWVAASPDLPRRGLRQAALTAAGMAVLAILAGAAALYQRRDEASHGIVLTEKAEVRLSPLRRQEVLGTPGLGRTVRIRGHNGGFHAAVVD